MKKMNLLTVLNQCGLLPVCSGREMLANLKRNWYFPISTISFFCLTWGYSFGYYFNIAILLFLACFFASQRKSIWSFVRHQPICDMVISIASSIGILLVNHEYFCERLNKFVFKYGLRIEFQNFCLFLGYIAFLTSILFLYVCIISFWKEIKKILREQKWISEIRGFEWTIYVIILIAFLAVMIIVFVQTDAFYGTKFDFDVIYTSDSPNLVKTDVYLSLMHTENDLRQPLFAVFAAPFLGIPSLLGQLFGAYPAVNAIAMNAVQVLMLFAANLMLVKMLGLSPRNRICFMILTCCSYTLPLFVLMMEQYIVAYFWLMLCMYQICEKQYGSRLPLWGAGGTLLTSIVLLPFCSDKHPIRQFRQWFWEMVLFCVEFGLVLAAFCRLDVIFNLVAQVDFLGTFTGEALTMGEKILQYLSFVSGCFAAPEAAVKVFEDGFASWQLVPVTEISGVGIAILVLCAVSAVWNREKRSSHLAVVWILLSLVMLVGMGWGTIENGLILYALYFGWAFLTLLFQLAEKIENSLKLRCLVPVCTAAAAAVMLAVNLPAIREMVGFALSYYPI